MRIAGLDLAVDPLASELPGWRAKVGIEQWRIAADQCRQSGGRLVALWASDRRTPDDPPCVSAAYALAPGLLWLSLPLEDAAAGYPDISRFFAPAGRMQRALADLSGWRAIGAEDTRPWLNHGAWPAHYLPLRNGARGDECFPDQALTDYAFVKVAGDGVHEIPVGPVHAGIIEPGHFRFSIVGEKVLRLEERLGYVHKGIEKRFEGLDPSAACRLAGRVSGDSTVAYAWAWSMAFESSQQVCVPQRAAWLRALMLERERVANHLGDLGALGNDAAFAFGLAQFSRMKEDWLRLNAEIFGHRFLMDRVVPGGVACDPDGTALRRLVAQCDAIEAEVREMHSIYDEHSGLQDRFVSTGRVTADLARRLGLCGMAGRASGLGGDLRAAYPWPPYTELEFRMAQAVDGDVAARVQVRFDEVVESMRLLRLICARLAGGAVATPIPAPSRSAVGFGWVECWRGDVFVALELDATGAIARCHCHDPSWQNWPVLEHAVIGNIVPDFPLINKSFNLSYSGQDL